jgi:hypothetical protein
MGDAEMDLGTVQVARDALYGPLPLPLLGI